MKYLGIEITTDGMVYYCREIIGSYMGLDGLKRDIRKLVLPTYKPTKTLAWLEEQTGFKWEFSNSARVLFSNDIHMCYDFDDDTMCVGEKWFDATPREFIEKIAKGEWV